ncbi:MAG: hypothetical protein WDZ76_12435 [Pseudohongiellaceae bacterium]
MPSFIRSSVVESLTMLRRLVLILALGMLAACSNQAALEAEQARIEAEQVAAQEEAARVEVEAERQRAMREARLRQAQEAERTRLAAEERRRQEELARMQAEEDRQREAAARAERERQQAIARAQADQERKRERIVSLEQQITELVSRNRSQTAANLSLQQAIVAAESLLEALSAEQSKYENTDDQGNTLEPLAPALIAEREQRMEQALREAEELDR